jgi:ABC-type multidrug transport system fused ATPase/permease subunit
MSFKGHHSSNYLFLTVFYLYMVFLLFFTTFLIITFLYSFFLLFLFQRRRFIQRNCLEGHQRLFLDYFAESPVYPPSKFLRRFRMQHSLFNRIQFAIEAHEPYFVQRRNAAKKLEHSSLQKIIAALRMLVYGVSGNFMDEYLRIAENTATQCLQYFVKSIIFIYYDKYLRSPNNNDISRLLEVNTRRGFPGMLGSIDCMHWK